MQDCTTIFLTQNQVAFIDSEDNDLSTLKWCAAYRSTIKSYYAVRASQQQTQYLHSVILSRKLGRPLVKGEKCDHKNGNTLDNRRSNLRLATHSQNQHNKGLQSNNTSGYKGVTFSKTHKKWRANIQIDNKKKFLGLFDTPEQAHKAYCKAAKELHGEFSRLE